MYTLSKTAGLNNFGELVWAAAAVGSVVFGPATGSDFSMVVFVAVGISDADALVGPPPDLGIDHEWSPFGELLQSDVGILRP